VLRRIFGPKRDEAPWDWRRLHNKELYAVCSSPNIIRMIKPRTLRWAGHIARMGGEEVHIGFYWENLREGNHLENGSVDGRIILKWILQK
jgi:hypothetical protein